MTVLGIETATSVCGVALVREDAALAERSLNIGTHHAERLLPMIREVLEQVGLALREVDGVAVSIGPGSFTGLRIGLSTAKGLCWSAGLPLIAVPTLAAFAAQFPFAACPVCPALDARKQEVYAGLYDTSSGEPRTRIAPSAVSPASFFGSLNEPTLFAGDGARLYRAEILAALGEKARFAPSSLDRTSAAAVAALGLSMLKRGETEDLSGAEPVYLRKSEAELKHGV